MEIDKFLHVGHVGTVWSYAGTWIAFSDLLHGPACYDPMGFTDYRIMGLGSLSDYCVVFLQLNFSMCR